MAENKKAIWDSTYNSISGIFRWILFVLAVSWALMVFVLGNIAGGILSVFFAVVVCPHSDKILKRFNIELPVYVMPTVRIAIGVLALAISLIFTHTEPEELPQSNVSIESEIADSQIEEADTGSENSPGEESGISSDATLNSDTSADNINPDDQDIPEVEKTIYPNLEVHFIDVGQGDCTLVTCDGQSMLIDCGPEDCGTKIQLYLKKHNVTRLDYLVLTHPDADHIGSADVIITKYEIDNLLMLDREHDTKTYRNVMDTIEYMGITPRQPELGETFMLGSTGVTVVGPGYEYEDNNNMSISLKVELGEKAYLFVGDIENDAQFDMAEGEYDLKADVYKVAHHGSRYSLNVLFFEKVMPVYAVISCGLGNKYEHPHPETLMFLDMRGCRVFRTDTQGTIVSVCDGYDIQWETANAPEE